MKKQNQDEKLELLYLRILLIGQYFEFPKDFDLIGRLSALPELYELHLKKISAEKAKIKSNKKKIEDIKKALIKLKKLLPVEGFENEHVINQILNIFVDTPNPMKLKKIQDDFNQFQGKLTGLQDICGLARQFGSVPIVWPQTKSKEKFTVANLILIYETGTGKPAKCNSSHDSQTSVNKNFNLYILPNFDPQIFRGQKNYFIYSTKEKNLYHVKSKKKYEIIHIKNLKIIEDLLPADEEYFHARLSLNQLEKITGITYDPSPTNYYTGKFFDFLCQIADVLGQFNFELKVSDETLGDYARESLKEAKDFKKSLPSNPLPEA